MKLNSEQVAFLLFLGSIASLFVMASLPGSQSLAKTNPSNATPKKKVVPEEKIEVELQEVEAIEEPETKEFLEKQPPVSYIFPEAEEEWIKFFKKHLWILASDSQPKMIRESQMILKQAPREMVEQFAEPYIRELLQSEKPLDRNQACVGIRYLQITSLVSDVLGKLPSVREEQSDLSTSFYLVALGVGDRSVSKSILSYAISSKVAKNRMLALESLVSIRDPEVVPPLLEHLKRKNHRDLDYPPLIQVLVQSMTKQYYPLLIQLFDSKEPQHRKDALFLMRQVDLPYFLEYYKKGLADTNPAIRISAYRYFTELAEPSCAEYLLERAKDRTLPRKERIFSLEGASRSGEKLNPRALDSLVQEKDPSIRLIALMTQAYLKDKQAIAGLIEMLSISDDAIIIPQGSDLEEERTWIREQVEIVLTLFTGKEFAEPWEWSQWWKQQKNFQFPPIKYMEKRPNLYINR